GGGNAFTRSHPASLEVSQSRTNCLSYETLVPPGSQSSSGQNRDESGVSTSSASTISSSGRRPNSNLVSARMTPRSRAIFAARRYAASESSRNAAASSLPTVISSSS